VGPSGSRFVDLHAGDEVLLALFNTTATISVNNKISGTGPDAIWDGRYRAVLGNDVTGSTANPDSGLAQIVLDRSLQDLPDTSDSTVVCKTSSDTVMNLGTNNKVIGCTQVASNNAQRSKMSAGPRVLKKKPLVH
jgi:hypothetical protein